MLATTERLRRRAGHLETGTVLVDEREGLPNSDVYGGHVPSTASIGPAASAVRSIAAT